MTQAVPQKKRTGRPPVSPAERLKGRSIRLNDQQWAKVDAGGMEWLRGLIDRAKLPAQGKGPV